VHDDADPGPRDLSAKDANKQIGLLPNAFTVSASAETSDEEELELTKIDPDFGSQGQSLQVTLSGSNLDPGTGVSFGSGVYVNSIKYDSEGSMIVDIKIDADAKPGARSVSVFGAHYAAVEGLEFTVEQTQPEPMEVAVTPVRSHDGHSQAEVEDQRSKKTNKKRAATLKTKKGD
jgi:Quinohemoprotein amine dehydrogenase, alpha subunit domain III